MRLAPLHAPLLTAAAVSLTLVAAPLVAQEDNQTPPAQPTNDQDQTPGLQQTPEGQTMKMAGEKVKFLQEIESDRSAAAGPSTGPTVPNSPPSK